MRHCIGLRGVELPGLGLVTRKLIAQDGLALGLVGLLQVLELLGRNLRHGLAERGT